MSSEGKQQAPSPASQWLAEQQQSRKLNALVFYRGSWCPFCQHYLQLVSKHFHPAFHKAGGQVFGISVDDEKTSAKTAKDWQLAFPTVSDPSLELARRFGAAITPNPIDPQAEQKVSQPAFIVLRGDEVLFSWAIDPSAKNLQGAKDRPDPADVWSKVVEPLLAGKQPADVSLIAVNVHRLKQDRRDLYQLEHDYIATEDKGSLKAYEEDAETKAAVVREKVVVQAPLK